MFRPTGLTLRAALSKERGHLLGARPPLPRSIQSCPAGQRQNTQETAPSKTKDLSAQFLERGIRSGSRFVPHPRDQQDLTLLDHRRVSPYRSTIHPACSGSKVNRTKTEGDYPWRSPKGNVSA